MRTIKAARYLTTDRDIRDLVEYEFVKEDGSYDITDPDKVIAHYVIAELHLLEKELGNAVKKRLADDEFLSFVKDDNGGYLELLYAEWNVQAIDFKSFNKRIFNLHPEMQSVPLMVRAEYDSKRKELYVELTPWGLHNIAIEFEVEEIADADVRYLAVEDIYDPEKMSLTIRNYDAPVRTLAEAEAILAKLQLHTENSTKNIWIGAVDDLIKNAWYIRNAYTMVKVKEYLSLIGQDKNRLADVFDPDPDKETAALMEQIELERKNPWPFR